MVVRDENDVYLGIRCDAKGCTVMSPPAEKILAGGGLIGLGWECHGGVHFCPIHATPKAP